MPHHRIRGEDDDRRTWHRPVLFIADAAADAKICNHGIPIASNCACTGSKNDVQRRTPAVTNVFMYRRLMGNPVSDPVP